MSPILALLVLVLTGVMPAIATAGLCPTALFLAPLMGALQAALAAIFVFLTFGSITSWFWVVAIFGNLLAVLYLSRATGRTAIGPLTTWDVIRPLTVLLAVGWPLMVLTAPIMGYDTEAIWLLHSAMVFGGHHEMLSSLVNPGAVANNPDYPPLVPGAVAVTYSLHGAIDQFAGVWTIAVLNAAALGVCGEGLLQRVPKTSGWVQKAGALVIVVLFLGAADGFAGVYAVNGYADLLWAAAAMAGTLFGLVLPCRSRNLFVAAACVEVASLTKNEGLTIGIALAVLIAARYWCQSDRSLASAARYCSAAAVTIAGGVFWYVAAGVHGLRDAFFSSSSGEALPERIGLTASGMWNQLHLLPLAIGVSILGIAYLRPRGRGRVLPLVVVWVVAAWAILVFSATYVLGGMEIHWWLRTSVDRTAIFVNLCLLSEMAIWFQQALEVAELRSPPSGRHFSDPTSGAQPRSRLIRSDT